MKYWLPTLILACCAAPLPAATILQCNINNGGWTVAGCADSNVFSNFGASLDWGAPTTAGGFSAHPLEVGLGTASANTFNTAAGLWNAVASNGVTVGVGAGPGVSAGDKVLQRTDNALQYFNPVTNPTGWAPISGALDSYYSNYSVFDGYANSAPIHTNAAGGFGSNTNTTDQFYTMSNVPNFYDHGTPNQLGPSPTAVPWVGDHLVGFNLTHAQSMAISFNSGGIDGAAFSIVGRSNNQTSGQTTAQNNWLGGGGTTPNGIFEILVQAYDNVNPLAGNLLFSYEVEVNGNFGQCAGLSAATPVPCNTAPVLQVLGTRGIFNIRSIVISSSTDSLGFFIDELYLDQGVPEPSAMLLIGGGLTLIACIGKKRAAFRR